jgi:hypothetical protein
MCYDFKYVGQLIEIFSIKVKKKTHLLGIDTNPDLSDRAKSVQIRNPLL